MDDYSSMSSSSSQQIALFADFDSGNMARYERVMKTPASLLNTILAAAAANKTTTSTNASSSTSENSETSTNNVNPIVTQKFDFEFNVWTRPDCEDTPVGPNSNRTWFYFGVRGGHGKFIKFNIMNMNKQNKLFEMGMLPVFKTVPGHEKWARIYLKPTWQTNEQNFFMSFIHRIPDRKDSISYFAFCFPFSYEECQSMLSKYDEQFAYCQHPPTDKHDPDMIYYHRELLTESLDKRRIDLMTISSYHNIVFKREPRFDPDHLFPDAASKRCFRYDKKRVFVVTSRVHPGETPASFVFNGFMEFVLRGQDTRARLLRRHFVFKLVPMLNPDGVARGYYRTDQRGVNLNRVYLDPSPREHPSIYAAKSLLVYHHVYNRTSRDYDGLCFDHVFKLRFDVDDDDQDGQNESDENENSDDFNDTDFVKNQSDMIYTDEPTLYGHTVIREDSDEDSGDNNDGGRGDTPPFVSSPNNISKLTSSSSPRHYNVTNRLVRLPLSTIAPPMQPPPPSAYTNRSLDNNQTNGSRHTIKMMSGGGSNAMSRSLDYLVYKRGGGGGDVSKMLMSSADRGQPGNENSDDDDDVAGGGDVKSSTSPRTTSSLNANNMNSPHLNDPKFLLINPLWSGLAFYIDLHGHAGKRGCFIYGNSIDNELFQVENVLFARLIAFSSQHFDFEGCNFSVKNMYMRDRGCQSKEGSGRVAMHKTLGLIHSYTLECSYAAGRVMNNLAPAANTSGPTYYDARSGARCHYAAGSVSPPAHNDLPPKFAAEHYADVGKGVALAALDLIEMNPHSRVSNTSFGSLEAVRNWVKFYVRSRLGGGVNVAAATLGATAAAAGTARAAVVSPSSGGSTSLASSATNASLSHNATTTSNIAKKSFVTQKSNSQRLSASHKPLKSNTLSTNTKSTTSGTSSLANRLVKQQQQQQRQGVRKSSLTATTSERTFAMTQRRSLLGKLIVEYENIDKRAAVGGGGELNKSNVTHKSSTFQSVLFEQTLTTDANVSTAAKDATNQSDSSSLSSTETVKAVTAQSSREDTKIPKERFRQQRKPLSISKASVLSNASSSQQQQQQEPPSDRVPTAIRTISYPVSKTLNNLSIRFKSQQPALNRGLTSLDQSSASMRRRSSSIADNINKAAASEPMNFLSLNKLVNKQQAGDANVRLGVRGLTKLSFHQQHQQLLVKNGWKKK